MRIIDAQIHLWSTGLPDNDAHWPVTSFSCDQALSMMDEAGVDAAIIHPPGWDPRSMELALEAVDRNPERFAIMGSLPLNDPLSAERIATWRQTPGVLGLRYLFLSDPARRWLHDGSLDWFWSAAADARVPIAVLATDSLPALGRIAARHPDLRLTIDHLGGRGGNTSLKDQAAMTHLPALLDLARHPNVAVKVTGAPGYSAEQYPYPTMIEQVRAIFEGFGPHRTFWGTDISKMPCSWQQCITMFTDHMPWISDDEMQLVMGDALAKWWRWDRMV